jgi:hypothetical protein
MRGYREAVSKSLLLPAVKGATREMKDHTVQMIAMSKQIDKLADRGAKAGAIDASAATAETDNPAPAGEVVEEYLPHKNSHVLGTSGRGGWSRTTAPVISISHCHGPASREDETDDGWKKVGRKHRGCPSVSAGTPLLVLDGDREGAEKGRKRKRG